MSEPSEWDDRCGQCQARRYDHLLPYDNTRTAKRVRIQHDFVEPMEAAPFCRCFEPVFAMAQFECQACLLPQDPAAAAARSEYLGALHKMSHEERQRLLDGNWDDARKESE